jgi:beta-glucosidase
VSVTVTNTGLRPSREVVQIYFQPATVDQPVRLVGWAPVTASAGESVRANVMTDARMWRRWNTTSSSWGVIGGGGQLLIARGLGDVRATLSFGDNT